MLHIAGKAEDLVGSYRPLSLTSCLRELLEKAVADDLSKGAEANKKFNKQQNGFRKNRSTNDNLLKLFETVKLGFCRGPTRGIFLDVEKAFHQVWFDGLLFKLTSMGLNRKLPNHPPSMASHKAALSPVLFILYVSDIPQPLDAQLNLSQFGDDSINLKLQKYLNQILKVH